MEINREKLAWAAGLFEGEGCFTVHKHCRGGTAVIKMSDKDVLDEFVSVVGIGKVVPKKTKTKPTHKQMYGVQIRPSISCYVMALAESTAKGTN